MSLSVVRSRELVAGHEGMVEELNTVLNSLAGGRNMAMMMAMRDGEPIRPKDIGDEYASSTDHWPEIEATRSSRTYASSQLRSASEKVVTSIARDDVKAGSLYALTDFAKERCLPTAMRVAVVCKKYDVAPIDLVGYRSTARTETGFDQPYSRIFIYNRMLDRETDEPITIQDLVTLTGLDHRVVHNHLPSLIRSGIFEGFDDSFRKRYSRFSVLADSSPITREQIDQNKLSYGWSDRKKELALFVVGLIRAEGCNEVTVEQIHSTLKSKDKLKEYFETKQKNKQNESINSVLEALADLGLVQAKPESDDYRLRSVAFTKKGREIAREYVQIIDDLLLNPELNRAIGDGVLRNQLKDDGGTKLMGWLIGIDIAKGATAIREKAEDKQRRALELIRKAGGCLLTSEILEATDWKRRAGHNILRQLVKAGKIVSEPCGREYRWRATEDTGFTD